MNKEDIILKHKAIFVFWLAFLIAPVVYTFIVLFLKSFPANEFRFKGVELTIILLGYLNIIIGKVVHQNIERLLIKSRFNSLEQIFSKFFTLNIISWALIESGCVLGLVLSFLTESSLGFIYLALPSVFCLLISKPNIIAIKNTYKKMALS